jgi:cysteinyl-tRNA synthetase
MSKSLGNFFTVRDLVDGKGASPLAVRYALISQNYGVPHNFTLDLLRDATNKVERYQQCEEKARKALADPASAQESTDTFVASLLDLYDEVLDAMCDNLNTSVALAKALEGTRVILREPHLDSAGATAVLEFLDKVNDLLGIVRQDEIVPEQSATHPDDVAWIEAQIAARAEAKQTKDFARADAIRNELSERGIELRDSPEGTSWKRRGAVL